MTCPDHDFAIALLKDRAGVRQASQAATPRQLLLQMHRLFGVRQGVFAFCQYGMLNWVSVLIGQAIPIGAASEIR